jgi:hypothetical protein
VSEQKRCGGKLLIDEHGAVRAKDLCDDPGCPDCQPEAEPVHKAIEGLEHMFSDVDAANNFIAARLYVRHSMHHLSTIKRWVDKNENWDLWCQRGMAEYKGEIEKRDAEIATLREEREKHIADLVRAGEENHRLREDRNKFRRALGALQTWCYDFFRMGMRPKEDFQQVVDRYISGKGKGEV